MFIYIKRRIKKKQVYTIRSPRSLVRHLRTAGCPRMTDTLVGQVASKYGLLTASVAEGRISPPNSTPETSAVTFSTGSWRFMIFASWLRFIRLTVCSASAFHSFRKTVSRVVVGNCITFGDDHGWTAGELPSGFNPSSLRQTLVVGSRQKNTQINTKIRKTSTGKKKK